MADQYITQRFINACIREDVYGILSNGKIIKRQFDVQDLPMFTEDEQQWLEVDFIHSTIWLPVKPYDYMQSWILSAPLWIQQENSKAHTHQYKVNSGYSNFIALLKQLEDSSDTALDSYLQELDCAVEHHELAIQAYQMYQHKFTIPIKKYETWSERLIYADQLASYLDHPYYPTARAKLGLNNTDIQAYSPEFAPTFLLNWVAVPKSSVTLTTALPSIWPEFSDLGLDTSLEKTHDLFPVHPLTIPLIQKQINDGVLPNIIFAPHVAIRVQPTLSVRTVVCCEDPSIHIKLPLIARTLGNKNIRLIKPSTIYDGHWFQKALQTIESCDETLKGKYYHCDESLGGHVDNEKSLAFIIRYYDSKYLENKTPVAVAALGSIMPDKRPFISHLIEAYYKNDTDCWLKEYSHLLCQVHLSLWIKYGIALESNQQNAIILFDQEDNGMSLLMKDNDAARILPTQFTKAIHNISDQVNLEDIININEIKDKRILVDSELPLAQMFLTITLQLDILAIIEMMSLHNLINRKKGYQIVYHSICNILKSLSYQGFNTSVAEEVLINDDTWYIKYLLSSGSLLSKSQSGALDINKFYGKSAPNTLKFMKSN